MYVCMYVSSAHEQDVSSVVNIPPDFLVTSSFDGMIVVWQRGLVKHSLKVSCVQINKYVHSPKHRKIRIFHVYKYTYI